MAPKRKAAAAKTAESGAAPKSSAKADKKTKRETKPAVPSYVMLRRARPRLPL